MNEYLRLRHLGARMVACCNSLRFLSIELRSEKVVVLG